MTQECVLNYIVLWAEKALGDSANWGKAGMWAQMPICLRERPPHCLTQPFLPSQMKIESPANEISQLFFFAPLVWWQTPVIAAPRKVRQDNFYKFKISLGYKAISYQASRGYIYNKTLSQKTQWAGGGCDYASVSAHAFPKETKPVTKGGVLCAPWGSVVCGTPASWGVEEMGAHWSTGRRQALRKGWLSLFFPRCRLPDTKSRWSGQSPAPERRGQCWDPVGSLTEPCRGNCQKQILETQSNEGDGSCLVEGRVCLMLLLLCGVWNCTVVHYIQKITSKALYFLFLFFWDWVPLLCSQVLIV